MLKLLPILYFNKSSYNFKKLAFLKKFSIFNIILFKYIKTS